MITAQEVVEVAIEAAAASGSDIAVIVNDKHDVNLRWAVNTLTTNGLIRDQSATVVAFHESRAGVGTASATGTVQNRAQVQELVAQARTASANAGPAEDAAPLISGGHSSDWTDAVAHTTASEMTTVASGLGDAFERGRVDGVEHFGFAEHSVSTTFLGTSAGTRLRNTQLESRLEMTAKSNDRTRSAWLGTPETNLHHVDITAMDADLRRSLAWQGNPITVAPGRHPVLFSSSAVADLMIELYWAADARSALDGHSVFSRPGGGTRVGDTLTHGAVTLSSDPHNAVPGMACADFEVCATSQPAASPFDNGLGLAQTDWIHAGQLKHLVTTRRTAELAGLPVTPGIDNLELTHADGSGTAEELAQRMGDGLLVTCLWYNRIVDPQTLLLTGLTRDGVYVVRDGEIVGACGNFRFNDSPVSALGRIVDAGSTVRTLAREMGDYFNRAAMPPLVIDGFNLSTASEAL